MYKKDMAIRSELKGTRRGFIKAATGLVALGATTRLFGADAGSDALAALKHPDQSLADRLGMGSFTFRRFNLDQTIAMTKQLGIKYLSLKSCHLPLNAKPEQLRAIAAKIKDQNLVLYSGGVIHLWKPAEVKQAFEYAKHAGLKLLDIMPTAALLPLIDKKVQKYDVVMAIHNHGPGDKSFPTPGIAYEKIKDLDPRIGICADIGHAVRYGDDLYADMEKCRDRIYDVHFKDVTSATPKGQTTVLGRGVIDIPRFLKIMQDIDYQGVLAFEYEPGGRNKLPLVAQSAGYARGVVAMMEKKS